MTIQSISEKAKESPKELEKDDIITLLTRAGNPNSHEQNDSLRILNHLYTNQKSVIIDNINQNNQREISILQKTIDNLQSDSHLTRELTGEIAPILFSLLFEYDRTIAVNQFQKQVSEDNLHGAQLALNAVNEMNWRPEVFESGDFTELARLINTDDDPLISEVCKFINALSTRHGGEILDSQTQDEIVYAVINRLEKTVNNELLEVLDELVWPEDVLSQLAPVILKLINHEDEHVSAQAIEWAEEMATDTPLGKEAPEELIKIAEEYESYIYDENDNIRADVFRIYALVARSREFLSNTSYGELTTHRRMLIQGLTLDSTRKSAANTIYHISGINKDIFVKELPVLVETLLSADSARVRSAVAGAIWNISDENPDIVSSAIPSLIQSLDDPSRRTVESVLIAIDHNLIDNHIDEFKPAIPRLIPLLDDSRGAQEVRGYANGVFGTIADAHPEWVLPYVPDLLSLAEDHPPALTHLETLSVKQPETIRGYKNEIKNFLEDDRQTARKYACSIAGQIALLEVVDELGKISREDPESEVRKAADEAIEAIAEEASERISNRARDPNMKAFEFNASTPSPDPIAHEVPFFVEQISDKLLLALNAGDLLDLHIYTIELVDFIRENPTNSPEHKNVVSRTESIIDGLEMEREKDAERVSEEMGEKIREVINRVKKIYLKG